MGSTVRATCPKCRTALRIPAGWVGQTVRCKQCGVTIRSRPKGEAGSPAAGTAESAPLDRTAPAPNVQPPARADDPFGLPDPVAPQPVADPFGGAPVPQPVPGYPYPLPPGYAPPGYPYPPPGYPPGAYAPPPGYPYPMPPGYGPPGVYVPPQAYPLPAPVAVPVPVQPSPVAPQPEALSPADTFGPAPTRPSTRPSRRKYQKKNGGSGKLIWVPVCLALVGGLVFGGVYVANWAAERNTTTDQARGDGKGEGKPETVGGTPAPRAGPFPRRLLFISVTKYMYLNPLTATKDGADQSKPAALRIAYDWRVPGEKENNQVFVLSDTVKDTPLVPVKPVVAGAFERFFETSRAQDRIVVYFGGHAFEKGGKAYLAPVEGEIDGDGWQNTLVPLDEVYAKLDKCQAAQKVVIWDVCRFNANRGKQRPGSDPMTPALHKALTAAPPGVEVIVSCSPGENAIEFSNFTPDLTNRKESYGGSAFLESVRWVGAKSQAGKSASQAEPLPIADWAPTVAKRVAEMAALMKDGTKQTVKLEGKPRADPVAYKPDEPPAKRFEMPAPPKGAAAAEIAAIEKEFFLPPIRPDLTDPGLADLPYLESVMKDYRADVPAEDVLKDREKYRLRAATLDAFNTVREVWAANADAGGVGSLKEVKAPITDAIKKEINRELEAYAVGIARLELVEVELDDVAALRAAEPRRWQAHYDYARAVVKARLAYLNEYNKLMGDVRTETLPELNRALGHDSYKLASAEKMKSRKEVQALAAQAQEAFAKVVAEHRGTPWAIQAKRDRAFSLGLVWQPFASAARESDASP
jgi:hypothetical protein